MLYKLNAAEIESSTRVEVRTPAYFKFKEQDIENFLKSRLSEIVSDGVGMTFGQMCSVILSSFTIPDAATRRWDM